MSSKRKNETLETTASRKGGFGKLTVLLLTAYVLFCMVLTGPVAPGEAATIPSGVNTTDTVFRDDMTAGYVLGSGTSTVTVVDPANGQVLFAIPLTGIPANTAIDIDWNKSAQRIFVSCNNGMILSVDPATSTFVVHANMPANNYTIGCAENWTTAATFGWAVDANTNWLHQILNNGTIVAVGAIPIGANVELAEKRWYGGAPTAQDGFLLGLGIAAGTGFTNVDVFDRATWLFAPVAAWNAGPANATGIATIKGPDAYISANAPAGGLPGYLLHLNLATNVFTPAATHTFAAETTFDVASAGIFVTVLTNGVGGGSRIQLFDMGDPTIPMLAGYQPASATAPGGGMATGGG